MRKTILVLTLGLAAAAHAADSTEFGVLYVPSINAQTIVSVPWLEAAATNAAVKVADLVLTSGLTVGDELKYYNGSKYECWRLEESGDVTNWVGSTSVSESGSGQVKGANTARLSRGNAIILKRTGTDLSNGFYIMGKPVTMGATDGLDLETGVHTLIAPPVVDGDCDINTGLTWTNLESKKEVLMIPDLSNKGYLVTYRYINGKWLDVTTGKQSGKIPVGTGAWFYSSGKTDDKRVEWHAPTSK